MESQFRVPKERAEIRDQLGHGAAGGGVGDVGGEAAAAGSTCTSAFNRNKSPHVSRLRGRRSQRRGEVGSRRGWARRAARLAPRASTCEPYRELIVEALARGRNAMAIWQDLVDDHGFPGRYASVRRYVATLRTQARRRGPREARKRTPSPVFWQRIAALHAPAVSPSGHLSHDRTALAHPRPCRRSPG